MIYRSFILIALATASFSMSATDISYPGGIAQILIDKESADLPIVRYGLKEPAIIDQKDSWKVLIGIDLTQLPGDYLAYIRLSGKDDSARFEKFQVMHKTYPLVRQDEPNFTGLKGYQKLSDLSFSNSQPPSLPMTLPFNGDWNTEFGYLFMSTTNSDQTQTQDYIYADAPELTLVKAPQTGIVCKIDTQKNGASNVIIDHGHGVFSIIHNIDDLAVDLGNSVTAGAVIGKVPGSKPGTIRQSSTNKNKYTSRVFWQVQLNGVFVNPLLMTQIK